MNIIGIYGAYDWDDLLPDNERFMHDVGCTIFIDGKHICSISEERLSRKKLDASYPYQSIEYCLSYSNIDFLDVDIVSYIPPMTCDLNHKSTKDSLIKVRESFPNAEIRLCSHHLAHAASTVFTSPFNEGTFLTFDGAGSGVYDVYRDKYNFIENNSIGYFNKEKRIFRFYNMPENKVNNFGHFYSFVSKLAFEYKMSRKSTDWYEWQSVPGKIMGLSAYGSLDEYSGEYTVVEHAIPYITFPEGGFTTYPPTPEDAAKWLQKVFEDGLLHLLRSLRKHHLDSTVCFAGGTYLNILANTKIKESGIFEEIHIPPFTDDSGLSIGAALWCCYEENETIHLPEDIAFLGQKYTNFVIEDEMRKNNLKWIPYDPDVVADKIENQKIVAWFQGRSEAGPRALGSRSILMSPTKAENKDILNKRVKHREEWRPFAGIIREEDVGEYFEEGYVTPHMLYSQTSKTDKIPAITHADKTCRIQTITREQNSRIYELLGKLEVPVVLNTSFNDNGQPIVESPYHAIEAFLAMDIDTLVIGDYIVDK